MEEPIQPQQPLTKTIHHHLGSQETINYKVMSLISLSSLRMYAQILEEIITKIQIQSVKSLYMVQFRNKPILR